MVLKHFARGAVLWVLIMGCKEVGHKGVAEESKAVVAEEQSVPASQYEDLEGNPVALNDYKGKRLLLNYWATWCRPCIEEMPDLLSAQEALSTENYVFLLASDQSVEKIKAFEEKRGFDFKFIKFNGAWADLGINALPVTVIYNEAGEEVERITGLTEWAAPEMIQRLKEIH